MRPFLFPLLILNFVLNVCETQQLHGIEFKKDQTEKSEDSVGSDSQNIVLGHGLESKDSSKNSQESKLNSSKLHGKLTVIKLEKDSNSVEDEERENQMEADSKVENGKQNAIETDSNIKQGVAHVNDTSQHANGDSGSVTNPPPKTIPNFQKDVIQSGALMRGFYVFGGLSVIVLLYFLFRSYRIRHNNQSTATVRKYGVTARRNDMEMRRLELDEDEDETLFEVAHQSTTNK